MQGFALVDEASKLNLNTATSAMIQALPLPGMTPEFADAIVAWRTANGTAAANAESYYTQLTPPRHNKGAAYESVDEVRLVVAPVVAGRGRRFLDGLPTTRLELIESTTSPTGSLLLAYHPLPR